MSQGRAKAGGERGANGEWYEGGKFIATTDRAKGEPRPARARIARPVPEWVIANTHRVLARLAVEAAHDEVDFANPFVRGEIRGLLATVGVDAGRYPALVEGIR